MVDAAAATVVMAMHLFLTYFTHSLLMYYFEFINDNFCYFNVSCLSDLLHFRALFVFILGLLLVVIHLPPESKNCSSILDGFFPHSSQMFLHGY